MTSPQSRLRWLFALIAAVALLGAGAVAAGPARADTPQLYALVDGSRAAAGLPPLRRSASLQAVAQAWADHMAATQTLAHNSAYTSQIPPGWTRAAENIGYAGSDQQLHDALMASPPHRQNILGGYTDIGIGRAIDSRGLVWEAQEFGAYAIPPGDVVPPPAPAPAPPPVIVPRPPGVASGLTAGQTLPAGGQLLSPNGTHQLTLQQDSNLVSYVGGRPVWSTGTWAEPVPADRLVLGADGQLVLYAGDQPLWWSATAGQGPSRLMIQDDGNAVLYREADGVATWSSLFGLPRSFLGTGQHLASSSKLWSDGAQFAMSFGQDGNLLVSGGAGPTWQTGALGVPGRHLWLVPQADGNLVVYSAAGALWYTGTWGQGPVTLRLQGDGNLVLLRVSDGRPVWSAWTGRLV